MFSAALLVVVALAVMSSMDVASRTSAATKGRTVASSLAEQDQERMRAMTINQLSNYHATADPTVGGVTYHVDSRSEWVQDTSGQVASCSDTGQASYVRISSTVTSAAVGRDTKPVVMRGIVAPPVGSLGPTRARSPSRSPTATATRSPTCPSRSPATSRSPTRPTPLGCAIFAYIPAGAGTSYTVTLNTPDWVDQNDDQISKKVPNVTSGGVTLQPMTYDQAGSASVDFRDSTNQPASPAPSAMTVVNPSWTTPGPRVVAPTVAGGLFPFVSSPYSLYAGSCVSANPGSYGQPVTSAAVTPTQNTGPVTVPVPTVNVKVVNGAGNGTPGSVSLKAMGAGCTDVADRQATAPDGTVGVDVPYGTYKICSSDGTKYKIESATVSNTASGGTSLITLKPSASSTGSASFCPKPLP